MNIDVSSPAPVLVAPVMLIGEDAIAFAQSQFSGDLSKLADGQWQWNAWLDPKGRVRALLQVLRFNAERLALLPRGADGDALAALLSRYVLRARVQVGVGPTLQLSDAPALEDRCFVDADDGWHIGFGDYATRLAPPIDGAKGTWRLHDIEHGHPWLPAQLQDSLLPPALSLNHLGAVSINKGCYPGQEITARLHYRGRHKRSLCHVLADQLYAGASIRSGDRDVGIALDPVYSGDGAHALAVLHEDILDQTPMPELHLADDAAQQVRVVQRFAQ